MSQFTDRLTNNQAMDFIGKFEDAFKSLPHLPQGIVEFFVKVAPWLAILGAVLSVFAAPVLGLFSLLSVLTLNPMIVLGTIVAAVISVVNAVLLFMAFRPLKDRQSKGWVLLFWSQMISVVSLVINVFSGYGFFSSVVGILIGLYILFEMKPAYFGGLKAAKK